MQLLATQGIERLSLENSKSASDDTTATKQKGEEHKKRSSNKQADPEAEAANDTSAEVACY